MKTLKKLLVVCAIAFAPALALGQTQTRGQTHGQHRPQNVHPVPAPSLSIAHEERGKDVEHTEDEGPPGDIQWWTTSFLNNPRVSYGAMAFNFLLLLFIYYRFGKQPLADGLKNRKISIATAIENAQRILREARQRAKKYKHKLDKVEDDAAVTKQSQIDTGKGDADVIVRNAKEKVARLARDVEFILDQEQKQTQLDLVRETVEKAAREAEALLRSNVSAADQERLAEEFLSKLTTDYPKNLSGGAS